ncbi:unnamed protein product [Parajaminaea phylloscopi]
MSGGASQHPYARFGRVPSATSNTSHHAPGSRTSDAGTDATHSASPSWKQPPSFAASASTSSLPGALGLGNDAGATHGYANVGRGPATIPFGLPSEQSRSQLPSPRLNLRGYAPPAPSGGPTYHIGRPDTTQTFPSPTARSPSAAADPWSVDPSGSSATGSPRRLTGLGGPPAGSPYAGSMGIASPSATQRDFLVPIGSTGARQKLSILSPSQRRTGPVATVPAPDAYKAASNPYVTAAAPSASSPYAPKLAYDTSGPPRGFRSDEESTFGSSYSLASPLATTTPPRPARSEQRQGSSSSTAPTKGASPSSAGPSATSASNSRRNGHSSHVAAPLARVESPSASPSSWSASATRPVARPAASADSPTTLKRPTSERALSGRSLTQGAADEGQRLRSDTDARPVRGNRDAGAASGILGGNPRYENADRSSERQSSYKAVGSSSISSSQYARASALPNEEATPPHRPSFRNASSDAMQTFTSNSPQTSPLAIRTAPRPSTASSTASIEPSPSESLPAGSAGDNQAPPTLQYYGATGDGRRPSTSSVSSLMSQGNDGKGSRKEGIKGKLGKILGASGHRGHREGGGYPDDQRGASKQRQDADSWTSDRSAFRGPASSSTSSLHSLTKSPPGPAVLPGSHHSSSSNTNAVNAGPSSAYRRTASSHDSRPRSGTSSSNAASIAPSLHKSVDDSTFGSYTRPGSGTPSTPTQSSTHSLSFMPIHSEPPELDLKVSDFSDLSSMLPAHMGFGSLSRAFSYDSLAASGAVPDKSLPPTPDSATPLALERKEEGSNDEHRGSGLVPAVLPGSVDDSLAKHGRQSSSEARTNAASGSRRGVTTLRPSPSDSSFSRRPSAVSLASNESRKDIAPSPALSADAAFSGSQSLRHSSTWAGGLSESATSGPTRNTPAQTSDGSTDFRRGATVDSVGSKQAKAATAQSASPPQRKASIDVATYVPPGALSFNRKGTAVRDRKAAEASFLSASDRFGPRELSTSRSNLSGLSFDFDSGDSGDDDDHEAMASEDRGSMLPSNAWAEVEAALVRFSGMSSATPTQAAIDKGSLIRTILLPFLALEAETPNLNVAEGRFRVPKARRALFFDWIAHLLIELQRVQTSADRGAILESIACIIESRNLSVSALGGDPADEAKFNSTFGHILLYAIGELNKKGVYQNTLIFSGRLLAVAFFRVTGVASKLLRALPINRFALERVAAEAGWEKRVPVPFERYAACFPATLRSHCFFDARSYLKMLDAQTSTQDDADDDRYLVRQPEVEVEMSGNWLRRWQSDDSELFFSFCRSYHRQLAALVTSTRRLKKTSKLFFGGPGYAHLATCIHLKCLSLVNRDILSVTTLSSQKPFNPGETANVLSGSTAGKPRHLEAANRRCTAIVVDIVRAPNANNDVFLPMLGVHIQTLVQRTSLYDVQGVFCLLDWLDGVLGHMDAAELSIERLVNIDFLITTLGLLLEKADHALALMRGIAFAYSNFAVLIGTVELRRRFCEEILLKPSIFQKLFLSWSFTIRAYFLHLLVFRLARLSDFAAPDGDDKGKSAVRIIRLFNQRLDEIRNRHEELSPTTPHSGSTDEGFNAEDDDGRSTYSRRAPSFVSTIKHTPSVVNVEASTKMTKAERVLGIGVPDYSLGAHAGSHVAEAIEAEGGKPRSRAAKWLRVLGGKNSKKELARQAFNPMHDSPTISNRPRFQQMPPLSELDLSDGDDDGSDGDEDAGLADEAAQTAASLVSPAPTGPSSGIDPSLHGDHIAADTTFDLQSLSSAGVAAGRHHSALSPRISRSLSKRTSILPRPAYELVDNADDSEVPPVPAVPAQHLQETAYPTSMHSYATLALREWEAVLAEHDEFFARKTTEDGSPGVPRLPVQWPAMWSD